MSEDYRFDGQELIRSFITMELLKKGDVFTAELIQVFFKYGLDPIQGFGFVTDLSEVFRRKEERDGAKEDGKN